MSLDTYKYTIKVNVEEDFGIRHNVYGSGSYNIKMPYINIHNNSSYLVDENLFLEESFWLPVKHFINNLSIGSDIDIKILQDFLGEIEYDLYDNENNEFSIVIIDKYNDYDLSQISWDGVILSFYYDSSPITWVDIAFEKGVLDISVIPKFGSSMFGISECDWDDLVTYLKGSNDVGKHRNMVIDDILSDRKEDPTLDKNLIRRLKFHALILSDNRFLKSVYDYYSKYGKLSSAQIESVSKIIKR